MKRVFRIEKKRARKSISKSQGPHMVRTGRWREVYCKKIGNSSRAFVIPWEIK